ncbi:ribosome small subunit-dependent GTPase A [Proteiniclasticum sp.]|uniref:ribosome small subunit-dependent GTPase A n=1 Tax=Proteiniclasticum sp. TaxID=2053595 RepID=UPI00289FD2FF|nr:ribosome small subunit-dependent GTPase A [Proteiniclasticum sp.]
MEGIIVKGIAGFYYVKTEQGVLECKARGVFRKNNITPMVGDRVSVVSTPEGNVVDEIHERTSELVRPFVANVSQAYVVFALRNPDINFELLNKFIISLEKNGIEPVLVFNKSDLATENEKIQLKELFKGTGYQIHFITAKDGTGLEELLKGLKDQITVLCGPSGAGKSTLLNKLAGSEKMETGIISEKVKRGKHTTRHSELIAVDDALLVDTPGFSTMEMTMEAKELKDYFPEFHAYEGHCRFQGCNHDKEPGCRVKDEVGKSISVERYNYYVKYYNELLEENKRKW